MLDMKSEHVQNWLDNFLMILNVCLVLQLPQLVTDWTWWWRCDDVLHQTWKVVHTLLTFVLKTFYHINHTFFSSAVKFHNNWKYNQQSIKIDAVQMLLEISHSVSFIHFCFLSQLNLSDSLLIKNLSDLNKIFVISDHVDEQRNKRWYCYE